MILSGSTEISISSVVFITVALEGLSVIFSIKKLVIVASYATQLLVAGSSIFRIQGQTAKIGTPPAVLQQHVRRHRQSSVRGCDWRGHKVEESSAP